MVPPRTRFLWALGGAVLVGGAYWMHRQTAGAKVRSRWRAAGVAAPLVAFLDWWELNGPFPVVVGQDGGVRTDAARQAELFRTGKSNAATLAETPHGRGGAVDLYPVIGGRVLVEGDEARRYMAIVGQHAKARGLVWGGDFKSLFDGPHVEVKSWRTLPMPGGGNV